MRLGCWRFVQRIEVRVKSEIERLRQWAAMRIRSGGVPDWSWPQHVRLIEALDGVLHDLALAERAPPRTVRYTRRPLRLVEPGDHRAPDFRNSGFKRRGGRVLR
jgi:hypothetical protein